MSRKSKENRECRKEKKEELKKEFLAVIEEMVEHPKVLQMKNFMQHGNTSCYQHCMNVAYYNYQICKRFGFDAKAAARGGLLHDMFLYDWHSHCPQKGEMLHAFSHPIKALQNAEKYFKLNAKEKDIIRCHMWPVTFFHMPRTRESWITVITDKYCSMRETSMRWTQRKAAQTGLDMGVL